MHLLLLLSKTENFYAVYVCAAYDPYSKQRLASYIALTFRFYSADYGSLLSARNVMCVYIFVTLDSVLKSKVC